jgi:sulfopyruvate decarboxylase subunit beta
MEAVAEAFQADELCTIVARVEAVGPDQYHMDLALPENAFRFHRHIVTRHRARTESGGGDRPS